MANYFEEEPEQYDCIACGEEIGADIDRAYAAAPGAYLCFDCAVERGGEFSDDEESWLVAPDLGALLEEPHPY